MGGTAKARLQGIRLNESVQKRGFGTAFFDFCEQLYRTHGSVDVLEISASDEIGGYAWATKGFEFGGFDSNKRHYIETIWGARAREVIDAALKSGRISDALAAEAEELFAAVIQERRGPISPADIAALGKSESWVEEENPMWLGKSILLGSSWNGEKPLTEKGFRGSETGEV